MGGTDLPGVVEVAVVLVDHYERSSDSTAIAGSERGVEMKQNDRRSAPKLPSRALMPAMAIVVLGGMSTMMGRGRTKEQQRKEAAMRSRMVTDPRVRAALDTAQRALDDARRQLASRDGRRIAPVIGAAGTISPTVRDAGEYARELAERLRQEGQARLPELNQRLREDVAPRAKTLAQEAIAEAEDILADARQRATEMSRNARRDYGPSVSNKASTVAGLVAAGSTAGYQLMRDRAAEVAKQSSSKRSRKMRQRARRRASVVLQSAGHQTKYVAGESFMVGFWTAALGTTVYFALLTPEQRSRIKGFLSNVISQIRDVAGGYRADSEEYQRTTM